MIEIFDKLQLSNKKLRLKYDQFYISPWAPSLDIEEKHWKFDPGDLAVRARWDDYMEAYADAIEKTTTDDAPWYVIPSDKRWYRKLAVAEIVLETLRDLDPEYPDPPENLHELTIPE